MKKEPTRGFTELFTVCSPQREGKTLYLNILFSETQHFECILWSLNWDDPEKPTPWLNHHEQRLLLSAFPVQADARCSHQWTIST